MQAAVQQISSLQLALVVGLPTLTAIAGTVVGVSQNQGTNARIGDLVTQFAHFRNEMNQRFGDVYSRLDLLTGKVGELTDRVTRIEAHLHLQ